MEGNGKVGGERGREAWLEEKAKEERKKRRTTVMDHLPNGESGVLLDFRPENQGCLVTKGRG